MTRTLIAQMLGLESENTKTISGARLTVASYRGIRTLVRHALSLLPVGAVLVRFANFTTQFTSQSELRFGHIEHSSVAAEN